MYYESNGPHNQLSILCIKLLETRGFWMYQWHPSTWVNSWNLVSMHFNTEWTWDTESTGMWFLQSRLVCIPGFWRQAFSMRRRTCVLIFFFRVWINPNWDLLALANTTYIAQDLTEEDPSKINTQTWLHTTSGRFLLLMFLLRKYMLQSPLSLGSWTFLRVTVS